MLLLRQERIGRSATGLLPAQEHAVPDVGSGVPARHAVRTDPGPETHGALLSLLARTPDLLHQRRAETPFLRADAFDDKPVNNPDRDSLSLTATDHELTFKTRRRYPAEGDQGQGVARMR